MKKWHKLTLILLVVALALGVLAFLFTMLHAYDIFGESHGLTAEAVKDYVLVAIKPCDELRTIDENLRTNKTCDTIQQVHEFVANHQEILTKQLGGCAFRGFCADAPVNNWALTPCFDGLLNTLHNMLIIDPVRGYAHCTRPDDYLWQAVYEFWNNFYQGVIPCCDETYNWEIVTGTEPPLQFKTFCWYVQKPVGAGVYSTLDECTAALP